MSTIEDLEKKVQSLRDQLREAEKSLQKARIDECPIKVGMVVLWRGTRYQVCKVDPSGYRLAKPWLQGHPQVKNGSWGIAVRHLYGEWELEKG